MFFRNSRIIFCSYNHCKQAVKLDKISFLKDVIPLLQFDVIYMP